VIVNLGCGHNPIPDAFNVDRIAVPGADLVVDLDDPHGLLKLRAALLDITVEEIIGVDFIEHVRNPLPLMESLWVVAEPDALCRFVLPYGTADDAWEDPTHVRPYFLGSWRYFSQPIYYRASYGYLGDWQTEQVVLEVRRSQYDGADQQEILADVMTLRNVVVRQEVVLRAIKPARPNDPALLTPPSVAFRFVEG
jgi:hypothetical protein